MYGETIKINLREMQIYVQVYISHFSKHFFFSVIINNDTAINSVDSFAICTEIHPLCSKFLRVYYIVLTYKLIILSDNYWLSLPAGSFIVLL